MLAVDLVMEIVIPAVRSGDIVQANAHVGLQENIFDSGCNIKDSNACILPARKFADQLLALKWQQFDQVDTMLAAPFDPVLRLFQQILVFAPPHCQPRLRVYKHLGALPFQRLVQSDSGWVTTVLATGRQQELVSPPHFFQLRYLLLLVDVESGAELRSLSAAFQQIHLAAIGTGHWTQLLLPILSAICIFGCNLYIWLQFDHLAAI